jgi:hypothetical protein
VNSVAWPDGMHLNSEGAVLFTSALAKDLPERVVGQAALTPRLFRQFPSPPAFPVRIADRES